MMDYVEAHKTFRYDPMTGKLYWRINASPRARAGDVAGTLFSAPRRTKCPDYFRVKYAGKCYMVHRVIWLLMQGHWPSQQIDHKDGNGLNNLFDNLREATHQQNIWNRLAANISVTQRKGVHIIPNGKFRAAIRVNGKRHFLGDFATLDAAHAVYCTAADKYHGEFANHG